MKSYDTLSKIEYGNGTAVALGYFDGVHIGHRTVLGAAVNYAKAHGLLSAAFTFALPETGGFKGKKILSAEEKHRRIENIGIDCYLLPPFSMFRNLSPQAFVFDVLRDAFGAKAVFCGDNFTFGKNKAGNVSVLKQLCKAAGIEVCLVPMAQYNGAAVSSTRVRAALENGDITAVNAMLGEDYCIDFTVHHGKAIGRTLGFPTINQIYPEGMLLPKNGVYITEVTLENGEKQPGATGLGPRPTVDQSSAVTCETFLPAWQGDVYGQRVHLRFCHYLKPILKFDTLAQLQDYIDSAAKSALEYFR